MAASDVERRVLEALDVEGLVRTAAALIRFPSVGGDETPVQEHMAHLLEELGLEVDVWELDLDGLAEDPAYGAEIVRSRALGVVGVLGAGEGPTLVLNGHVDVVPAGDPERWSVSPWEGTVEGGRLRGRGAADTKGGLASALAALEAVRRAGPELEGRVVLQSVVGEEDGGVGTLAAIRRGHTGDGAVVLEPTRLNVAPAQAGALSFRITVPGRAAHGALRAEGVSPVEKFIPLYRALMELERRRNAGPVHPLFSEYEVPYAIAVGTVRSGIWPSTVAESLVFEGRLGVAAEERPGEARRALEEAVREAAAADPWLSDNPPVVEWWGARFLPAVTPADHPLVTTLTGALAAAGGGDPVVRGMPYGADMGLLVNEGKMPAVLFGPGDVREAHAPDESVPIRELEIAARTLALTILRFCG